MKKRQKEVCPIHKEELWQINHGYGEDRYICIVYKCSYTKTTAGTEPDIMIP